MRRMTIEAVHIGVGKLAKLELLQSAGPIRVKKLVFLTSLGPTGGQND